jgi:transglycosylase-like protein with SLT domain
MRVTLAFAILLLALSSAAPEPEYSLLYAGDFHAADGDAGPGLIQIESSIGRGDRLSVTALRPRDMFDVGKADNTGRPTQLASADADTDIVSSADALSGSFYGTEVSLGDLCNALFTSAQDNDLPVQFFANLIWQESRLRDDAVSKKGAMGIAQFMPQAAVENGLDDPFDPLQAIPASARFLHTLRLQFGNLGFVAAAYNAGARRVAEWLEHRGSLPSETRTYVVRVTGLSVDAWRSMPVDSDALTFVQHLPCRNLPAFANVEQEQSLQAQLEQVKLIEANYEGPQIADADVTSTVPMQNTAAPKPASRERHEARHATHERRPVKREAAHAPRGGRDKHSSA